jgi:hypothetical protein
MVTFVFVHYVGGNAIQKEEAGDLGSPEDEPSHPVGDVEEGWRRRAEAVFAVGADNAGGEQSEPTGKDDSEPGEEPLPGTERGEDSTAYRGDGRHPVGQGEDNHRQPEKQAKSHEVEIAHDVAEVMAQRVEQGDVLRRGCGGRCIGSKRGWVEVRLFGELEVRAVRLIFHHAFGAQAVKQFATACDRIETL